EGIPNPNGPPPQLRLPPALSRFVLIPTSLFWFGWAQPPSIRSIVPIIRSVLFGAELDGIRVLPMSSTLELPILLGLFSPSTAFSPFSPML
ncbi:MAG: hypothetical protein Q9157_001110, partial [Trypethelium eluteriae]